MHDNKKNKKMPYKLKPLALASAISLAHMPALALPGTAQIEFMDLNYALVEINQSSVAYEQLVTRHDSIDIPVKWTQWSGDSADTVRYLLNGEVIQEDNLAPGDAQSGEVTLSINKGGQYTLTVQLCDASGCTISEAKQLVVADTDGSHVEPITLTVGENNRAYDFDPESTVVASYFVEWGVYGRKFPVDRIPAYNLTHIIYGFIPICGGDGINDGLKTIGGSSFSALQNACAGRDDFKVAIHDPWAAIQRPAAGHEYNTPYKGNFGQFMELKKAYPHLKIVPSIGGWTLSDPFFHFDNPEYRKRFVDSVGEFLRTWKFFDGIDIDWEFPGGQGATPGLGNPETDGEVYVLLMKELREKLDEVSAETGKTYELTSAIGNSPAKLEVVDFAEAAKYMDYIFPLTYDFYGAWSNNVLGHQTALNPPAFRPGEQLTTTNIVDILIEQGVSPQQIAVGAAMYGRGWTGVQQTGEPLLAGTATGPVAGTWEAGVVDYRQIAEFAASGEWQYSYDAEAEAPLLYRPGSGDLITYDDARSVKAKGQYVQQHNLAGFFSWELDADNGDILNAMHEGLGHTPSDGSTNRAPIANAGNNQTVTADQTVTLNGASSSDPDGDALTYQWQQTSGPSVTLNNANRAQPSFTATQTAQQQNLVFSLTVSDGTLSSSDSVGITITAETTTPTNTPPEINLVSNLTLVEGTSQTITANVTDADGDTVSLNWQAGNGLTVSSTDNASITVTAGAVDIDTLTSLTLTANDGTDSASHTINVNITANDDNGGGDNGGVDSCDTSDDNTSTAPAYDASTVYLNGDQVSHGGLTWQAKWWTKGTAPGVGVEVWQLVSDVELPWSADETYNGGDEVNHDGRRYRAKWWSKGNNPTTSDVWVDVGAASCD